jgi:hypothetical protein
MNPNLFFKKSFRSLASKTCVREASKIALPPPRLAHQRTRRMISKKRKVEDSTTTPAAPASLYETEDRTPEAVFASSDPATRSRQGATTSSVTRRSRSDYLPEFTAVLLNVDVAAALKRSIWCVRAEPEFGAQLQCDVWCTQDRRTSIGRDVSVHANINHATNSEQFCAYALPSW